MSHWASLFAFVVGLSALPAVRADNVMLVAGGGEGAENVPATSAKLFQPFGIDRDSAGNLFFVEIDGHRVCKIDAKGILTKIAGTGNKGLKGDGGPALAAEFNSMKNVNPMTIR